jgi:very-short-patch-repair endonuclease
MKQFKKITEEIFYDEDGNFDLEKNVVDEVYNEIYINSCEYRNNLKGSIIDCESPIEQLLAINLERINLLGIGNVNPFVDVIAIEKQQEIKISKKVTYRVDFLITVDYKNQGMKGFVIECDGHEFHQKTKEQVEKDNQRTRDLQMKGLEVIRFSGTEIWHRAYRCACEIRKLILSKCEYKKEKE